MDGSYPVLPTDMLAFRITSSIIRNAHFVNADAFALGHLGEFGCHLRLESEAVLLEGDTFDDVGAEELVAGLHVGEVEVGKHVGEPCEEFVPFGMPEKGDAMGLATTIPRTINHIGETFYDRVEEEVVLSSGSYSKSASCTIT